MAEKNMNAKISVEFEETANRQQLSSGDNLPTLFGKIKKFFTDLKPVAMSGSYNDLDDKPVVDEVLDVNSENLIQNKAVATKFEDCFQSLGGIFEGSIKDIAINCEKVGVSAFIGNTVTDMPYNGTYWTVYITGGGTTHRCITAIQIDTGKTYQTFYNSGSGIWSAWHYVADDGNADTLDGYHATSFFQEIGALNSGSIKDYALNLVGSGAVFISNIVTDMPLDNTYWFAIINKCNTNHILLEVTQIGSNKKYVTTYNAGTTPPKWYDWSFVGDGGNAASINTQYQAPITTANTILYPTLVDANNSTPIDEKIKTNDSIKYQMKAGTTSATGYVQLQLGSTKQTGTEGNMQGQLVFFGPYHQFWAILAQNTAQTGNANYLLPATGGTLALNTVATASANGLMSTDTQTFAGAKTFNGIVKVAGATAAGTSQVRNIAAGTAAATTSNCPSGCLYGQYS